MEGEEALRGPSARLTELFVDDMDGQLRQSGVGDLVMGKRMGKLMSVLGCRLDAIRTAMAEPGDDALMAVIERNVTLGESAGMALIGGCCVAFMPAFWLLSKKRKAKMCDAAKA